MTTPGTLASIIADIRERLADAQKDSAESHRAAMNSYGAGHDAGRVDAFREVLQSITGEDEDADAMRRDREFMAIGPSDELLD